MTAVSLLSIPTNDNIGYIFWQVIGSNPRAYDFEYDFLNRLTGSVYGDADNSSLQVTNKYNTSYTYDPRGNIAAVA